MVAENALPAPRPLKRRARHPRENPKGFSELVREWRKRAEAPSFRAVLSLAVRAMHAGAAVAEWSPRRLAVEWDHSKSCQKPVPFTKIGIERMTDPELAGRSVRVDMQLPCRKCEECRERDRRRYTACATRETEASSETLSMVLTFSPQRQYEFITECRLLAAEDGVDFDQLAIETQFERMVERASRSLTLFLKRVRKNYPGPYVDGKLAPNWRYIAVAEPHGEAANNTEDVRPHFHVLLHAIHQPLASTPLVITTDEGVQTVVDTWPDLEELWSREGQCRRVRRVVSASHAAYVTKYIAKSFSTRVKHSLLYGDFAYPAK